MPDNQDEETGVGHLPAPTPAPDDGIVSIASDDAALSDEELKRRQDALGTKRKPAGPQLGQGPDAGVFGIDQPEDVPPTEVTEAAELEPEDPEPDSSGIY
jgi:hypothetical protein